MPVLSKRRWIWIGAVLLWIALIFGQSLLNGTASSSESGAVLRWLRQLFTLWGGDQWITEHMIRKAAHFTEYALLGVLLIQTAGSWGYLRSNPALPLFFSLFIPVLDEGLQLLVPGRSGQLSDVLLDFAGALTGMGLCLLFRLVRRRKRSRDGDSQTEGR
ncbi:MAG: VanZ family protein [Clostridiales bacterium]|nr:VanZ family protein [Clostridiales bacterium]